MCNKNNELSTIALNSNYTHSATIYNLINNNNLSDFINKLDSRTEITNKQFIENINNFLIFFENDFYCLGNYKKIVIENMFKYGKINNFLLSNKYVGNNKNINYYNKHYKYFITQIFIKNLTAINISNKIKKLFNEFNIDITIKNDDLINNIYTLLKFLILCNPNEYRIIYLFTDLNQFTNEFSQENNINLNMSKIKCEEYYITQLELTMDNYYINKDKINIF